MSMPVSTFIPMHEHAFYSDKYGWRPEIQQANADRHPATDGDLP